MKVAIVHYWLVSFRGGEKVIKSLLNLYPDADIYTLFADQALVQKEFPNNRVYSCLFDVPFIRKHYQKLFPLYPLFIASLKLRQKYDLLISSESGPSKGVRNRHKVPHLCYIHSPMRYAWGFTGEYLRVLPWWSRPLASFLFKMLQLWDSTTVAGVDRFVANSQNVARRVERYYHRQAEVVYPPIETAIYEAWPQSLARSKEEAKDHFVCFGALVPYKRMDLAIECFNKNGLPLKVYGTGAELERLQRMAGPNVQVLGPLAQEDFVSELSAARALIFPGEEDFGMIPVEVMALGVPVIAFAQGGALETVVENEDASQSSGVFFSRQTVASLQEALERFLEKEAQFDAGWIHAHACGFSEDIFLEKIKVQIDALLARA